MSKRFDREQRVIDRLEQENRELKKQVRSLQKHLKKLSRGYMNYLDQEDTNKEEALKEVKKSAEEAAKVCWTCGQKTYNIVHVANRRFRRCKECGKQGKVTILD